MAQTLVEVLKQCGDDLTRDNVMKQAENLTNFRLPMLLPGITLSTSETNFSPIQKMQLQKFDGAEWERFGEIVGE
jgi:branched-chain amino acid transport system substrate-binding protein